MIPVSTHISVIPAGRAASSQANPDAAIVTGFHAAMHADRHDTANPPGPDLTHPADMRDVVADDAATPDKPGQPHPSVIAPSTGQAAETSALAGTRSQPRQAADASRHAIVLAGARSKPAQASPASTTTSAAALATLDHDTTMGVAHGIAQEAAQVRAIGQIAEIADPPRGASAPLALAASQGAPLAMATRKPDPLPGQVVLARFDHQARLLHANAEPALLEMPLLPVLSASSEQADAGPADTLRARAMYPDAAPAGPVSGADLADRTTGFQTDPPPHRYAAPFGIGSDCNLVMSATSELRANAEYPFVQPAAPMRARANAVGGWQHGAEPARPLPVTGASVPDPADPALLSTAGPVHEALAAAGKQVTQQTENAERNGRRSTGAIRASDRTDTMTGANSPSRNTAENLQPQTWSLRALPNFETVQPTLPDPAFQHPATSEPPLGSAARPVASPAIPAIWLAPETGPDTASLPAPDFVAPPSVPSGDFPFPLTIAGNDPDADGDRPHRPGGPDLSMAVVSSGVASPSGQAVPASSGAGQPPHPHSKFRHMPATIATAPPQLEILQVSNPTVSLTIGSVGAGLEILIEPRHPLELLDRSIGRLVEDMRNLGYTLDQDGHGAGSEQGDWAWTKRNRRLAFTPTQPDDSARVAAQVGPGPSMLGRMDLRL